MSRLLRGTRQDPIALTSGVARLDRRLGPHSPRPPPSRTPSVVYFQPPVRSRPTRGRPRIARHLAGRCSSRLQSPSRSVSIRALGHRRREPFTVISVEREPGSETESVSAKTQERQFRVKKLNQCLVLSSCPGLSRAYPALPPPTRPPPAETPSVVYPGPPPRAPPRAAQEHVAHHMWDVLPEGLQVFAAAFVGSSNEDRRSPDDTSRRCPIETHACLVSESERRRERSMLAHRDLVSQTRLVSHPALSARSSRGRGQTPRTHRLAPPATPSCRVYSSSRLMYESGAHSNAGSCRKIFKSSVEPESKCQHIENLTCRTSHQAYTLAPRV